MVNILVRYLLFISMLLIRNILYRYNLMFKNLRIPSRGLLREIMMGEGNEQPPLC